MEKSKGWTRLSLYKAYERFVKIRGNPKEIALGFALGIFIGVAPIMGIQTAIAVFLAALLKWNKISAAIGVWISNPITAPFLYSLTYVTGAKIFGLANGYTAPQGMGDTTFLKMILKAPNIFWALIVGGVIIGLPLALAGYYFSFTAVQKYQDGIKRKLAERKARRAAKKKAKKRKKQTY